VIKEYIKHIQSNIPWKQSQVRKIIRPHPMVMCIKDTLPESADCEHSPLQEPTWAERSVYFRGKPLVSRDTDCLFQKITIRWIRKATHKIIKLEMSVSNILKGNKKVIREEYGPAQSEID